MNTERSVIASVLFLGLGLGLILGFCHNSTIAFSAARPAAGAALQIVINTNGWPAMLGVAATVLGVLFLFVALVLAVLRQVEGRPKSLRARTPAA
jgi:hypothetical protein